MGSGLDGCDGFHALFVNFLENSLHPTPSDFWVRELCEAAFRSESCYTNAEIFWRQRESRKAFEALLVIYTSTSAKR